MKNLTINSILISMFLVAQTVLAIDYPYQTNEPQKTGWPLSDEERAYVLRPEHERRPGREANMHLPAMWPVVPSAGNWGGTSWLDTHARLVEQVKENAGPCDALLVGDSITIQWGDAWKRHFPKLKAINIGIGGDKTQNVLWRLDHGGVDGLQPKLILLMIGNNNMFFTPETGIEPAAQGIEMCVKNLRDKFPKIPIIVAKILPAHEPGNRFYEDIKKTNAALETLKLESNPNVFVLDLWDDFTTDNGMIEKDLFTPDNIHLSATGYAVYAKRLEPMIDAISSGQSPSPTTATIVNQLVAAVGGEDKLLRLFRTRETVNVSTDPEKKVAPRVSVYEPPKYWWTGKNERVKNEAMPDEPATFLVWAWTLGILKDPASQLEVIPEIMELDKPALGLRVSGTVSPAMDLYFYKEDSRLVRIDWRSDIHRFSDWRETDGIKYPAKCTGYKKTSGKPWYFSEIIELERLKDLPEGLQRRQ